MRLLRRSPFYLLLAVALLVLPTLVDARADPTTPDCGTPLYKPSGAAWQCTFDDEFSGSVFDWTKWWPVTTAQNGISYGGACFTSSPKNIYVSGGYLYLTARKESAPIQCGSSTAGFTTSYTTGQLATLGRFSQTYGLFAVRAKFPAATVAGLQSSLWMWPQNLATTGLRGEIDIAEEYSSYADRVIPYLHYSYDAKTVNTFTNTNVVTRNCLVQSVSSFHVYAAEWNTSTITIYIDGKACLQDSLKPSGASPFDQPFFMVLTQALGTGTNPFNPSSTPLPASTVVDWVRAYK
jgi:beta-glucanase (GH16 family)